MNKIIYAFDKILLFIIIYNWGLQTTSFLALWIQPSLFTGSIESDSTRLTYM